MRVPLRGASDGRNKLKRWYVCTSIQFVIRFTFAIVFGDFRCYHGAMRKLTLQSLRDFTYSV